MSLYERWIGGPFGGQVPPRESLLPRRLLVVVVVSIAVLVFLVGWRPRITGLPAGIAALIACASLELIWLRSWAVVTARAHRHLLTRPELGDARRVATFLAVFVGYGVVSLALLMLLVVLGSG